MNLKNGKVFTSKFVGTGPSCYEEKIYRAAVSQRLRNTDLEYWLSTFRCSRPQGIFFCSSRSSKANVSVVVRLLLGVFEKMQKRLSTSSYLSVCPHGTNLLLLERFSWNLTFEYFSKNLARNHKVRHPRCVYNKLDWNVYTCLTQLYGGVVFSLRSVNLL